MPKSSRTLLLAACASLALTTTALAQSARPVPVDVPAGDLGRAINTLARQTKSEVAVSAGPVQGKRSRGLKGTYAPAAALAELLKESGLTARTSANGAFIVEPARPQGEAGGLSGVAQVDEVVVTGSRINGVGPIGSEQIQIGREDIARAGRTTTADLLNTLTQASALGSSEVNELSANQRSNYNLGQGNGVNLRGLGQGATLTLLNGRRMAPTGYGSFVDVSQIPVSAIQRIDVVADGASAIYGSDAIGGVVNIILRKDFAGTEVAGRYAIGEDFEGYSISASHGTVWDTGNLFISAEYYYRSRLAASDRSVYSEDYSAFGGPDLRWNYSSPGTLRVGGQTYAIPAGQTGVGLTPDRLIAATANRSTIWLGADALPRQERASILVSGRQQISDDLEIFADLLASQRDRINRSYALYGTLTVPRTNAFFVTPVPGAASVSIDYNYLNDYGTLTAKGPVRDYTLTTGARLKLPFDWSAEAVATLSQNELTQFSGGYRNSFYLREALASSDPATAFNPFGVGGTSAATLARVQGWSRLKQLGDEQTAGATLQGPLFALPGGMMRLALGVEYREQSLKQSGQSFTSTAAPAPSQSTSFAERNIKAAYAEIYLPLVRPEQSIPLIASLQVTAAARAEEYSDFGRTVNPKVGVNWWLNDSLMLRGSYGTSYNAPLLNELVGFKYWSAAILNGLPIVYRFGSNPDLKAEKATTWSLGATLRPKWIPGFEASINYFNIDYRDRVQSLLATDLPEILAHPGIFQQIVTINPTVAQVNAIYARSDFQGGTLPADSIGAIVDFGIKNVGTLKQSGVDLSVRYNREFASGQLGLSGSTTYIDAHQIGRTAQAPLTNYVNRLGYPGKWKSRGAVNYTRDTVDVSVAVNFASGYTNQTVAPFQHVSSWRTVDAHLGWAPDDIAGVTGLKLALDIQNVADSDPPYVQNPIAYLRYDPGAASALGRVVTLSFTKTF